MNSAIFSGKIPNFHRILAIMARKIFIIGPANATKNVPNFLGWSFEKFTGTGFAQPIRNGALVIKSKSGKTIEPSGSICLMGFRLKRPICFAVVSPKLYAARPWLNSCNTTAKTRHVILINISIISFFLVFCFLYCVFIAALSLLTHLFYEIQDLKYNYFCIIWEQLLISKLAFSHFYSLRGF